MSQVHQPSRNVNYRKGIGALDSFVGALDSFVGALDSFVGALDSFVGALETSAPP